MVDVISLPVEILRHISSFTDRESCKQLGLTCRLFRDTSKPWLFRDTMVSPTDESCEQFETFLEYRHLSQYVTKIYLDISKFEPDEPDFEETREENIEDGEGAWGAVLPRRFWNLFGRLAELPRLRSVALCFSHDCENSDIFIAGPPQTSLFRSIVMNKFMSSLSSLPRLPRELAIRNLQNINATDPTTKAMITLVLKGLQSLRLNIINEHSEQNGELDLQVCYPNKASRGHQAKGKSQKKEPHIFYTKLPSIWLKPTTSNLRHLTLYSNLYFGFYPKLDLREAHFPHLETLSLGNYAFVHDSQLDWILSHGSTLTELYLDDCTIIHEVATYDKERTYLSPDTFRAHPKLEGKVYASYEKRWHDYFRAFKDGLPLLRHFRYGTSPYWWGDVSTPFEGETEIKIGMTSGSYQVFCDGYGPSPYMDSLIWDYDTEDDNALPPSVDEEDEEDKEALRELCGKIGQPLEF
ncbi:hypothetical protein FQN54_000388 [Arachnomyces sp. PD_36]|nr:hypothetical protein FQN54_000388 [Arachnomyces sp. PD_36]